MYTANGPYMSWEENIKGTLEPGKLADMIVLDKIQKIHLENVVYVHCTLPYDREDLQLFNPYVEFRILHNGHCIL